MDAKRIARIIEATKTDIRCSRDTFLADAEIQLELSIDAGAVAEWIASNASQILGGNADGMLPEGSWDYDAAWVVAAEREVAAYASELYGAELTGLVAEAETRWVAEQAA